MSGMISWTGESGEVETVEFSGSSIVMIAETAGPRPSARAFVGSGADSKGFRLLARMARKLYEKGGGFPRLARKMETEL